MYNKDDGHVDPYSLTQAYAAGARLHGAEVYLNSPVTALRQRSDGRWDVQTDHGTFNAKRVVNCAGNTGLLLNCAPKTIPVCIIILTP